ncbi:hypothetical protein BN946_scf184815.g32 [Trametes cinnabarina]|uniref:FAD-binding domain-containing protein n=1 Tax=Pycnoporus cinnabarinus TaxID=5643 RepID=A0A060S284_PYCCI|nr:hypothetical protein BN946_scf184815.g32 [Trametes cinnabarina]
MASHDNAKAVAESYVDVLIVGAGPAGVMCANALVHAGVTVRIVDKRLEGISAGQADGLQPRTLEILQSYGLADQLFNEGAHVHRVANYEPTPDGGLKRIRLSAASTAPNARWTFGVGMSQGRVEEIFLASMQKKGLAVERATVPTSLKMSGQADGLEDPGSYVNTVVLQKVGGHNATEVVHAKFVLGSDGAHSWVRKALGIGAEGTMTNSVWGVVDLLPDTDMPDIRNLTYVHSSEGTLFTIPRERDLVRLYVPQANDSEVIDPATGRADKNRSSAEKVLAQARKLIYPYRMEVKDNQIDWWTIYIVGQRVADRYSVHDRALIAGDACHTHSPKAGQGMNAALGDSHNLAWKLAYVLKGWAKMLLLRTYESERQKFARDLIEFDKQWSKLFMANSLSSEDRDDASKKLFIEMMNKFSGFTSGIGIRYSPSTIVNPQYQTSASNLIVGERMIPQMFICAADGRPVEIHDMLPADSRFKLLVFGGDIAVPGDLERLREATSATERPESFLSRYGRAGAVFDVLYFSSGKQANITYADFPQFYGTHWKKAFLDDVELSGRFGGGGYEKYGIDPHVGAMVIIRPDGYVGMVAPLSLHGVEDITTNFDGFLL